MDRKIVSGIMLTLLFIGIFSLTFENQPVEASGTIYISSDYTFTSDIYEPIVVTADNIIIDGAGYTLQGTGSGTGIDLSYRNNVTLKNVEVTNFTYGIYLDSSSNNNISGNTASHNTRGIYLESSSNNNISGNIASSNTSGILLVDSSNNTISGNTVSSNDVGICLVDSSNNTISGNTASHNTSGILFDSSNNNTISGNTASNNDEGIYLWSSSNNNTVTGNNASNNDYGIRLRLSSNNTVTGNNASSNNNRGIYLYNSSDNAIYHNDFIDNTYQTFVQDAYTNIWDDGYPSGGNYWSDYNGTDKFSGPYQNETGSDFIGDTEYKINDDNIDHYPLMIPYETNPPTITIMSPENKTYTTEDVPLTFTVSESTSWIKSSLDGQANITIAGNTTLTGLSDGMHSLVVYASDIAGNIGSSDIVYFTVQAPPIDTTPPSISIVSPENKTYDTTDIPLTFTIDESTSWMGYSLDGQANVTITGNTTLSGLSDGSHSLIVYAKDTAGNTGTSEIIYFTIESEKEEPFPTWIVATIVIVVIIAVVGALLVYFTKVKKTT